MVRSRTSADQQMPPIIPPIQSQEPIKPINVELSGQQSSQQDHRVQAQAKQTIDKNFVRKNNYVASPKSTLSGGPLPRKSDTQ